MEKKEIILDDRDYENQILEIPDKISGQEFIYSLKLRSYYDKNKAACIEFINNHKLIKQIEEAEIRFYNEMDLSSFENIRKLSIDSNTFHPSNYPKINTLKKLESLTLWYTPAGDEASLKSFLADLENLPALNSFKWNNCEIKSIDSLTNLQNITNLEVGLCWTDKQVRVNPFENKKELPTQKNYREITFSNVNNNLKTIKVSTIGDVNLILPKNLDLFKKLQSIDFSNTNLANIDNFLLLRENLKNVKINFGHAFEKLEKQMNFPLDQAVDIDLYGLNLTEVPKFIEKYRKIKSFEINCLKKAYKGIFKEETFNRIKAESIETFRADCALKSFPAIIQNMIHLKELILGEHFGGTNNIENIPDWIGNLKNLERLVLVGNKIGSFPESIKYCGKLKNLVLYYDDGDYVHSNPICDNKKEIDKLTQLIPHCNITYKD